MVEGNTTVKLIALFILLLLLICLVSDWAIALHGPTEQKQSIIISINFLLHAYERAGSALWDPKIRSSLVSNLINLLFFPPHLHATFSN